MPVNFHKNPVDKPELRWYKCTHPRPDGWYYNTPSGYCYGPLQTEEEAERFEEQDIESRLNPNFLTSEMVEELLKPKPGEKEAYERLQRWKFAGWSDK